MALSKAKKLKSKHRLRVFSDMARHIEVDESLLRETLEELTLNETSMYRSWEKPKRSGGTRPIDEPRNKLKFIQERINDRLLQTTRLHKAAMGGVRGKHLSDNLHLHANRPMVVNFDLEQFFLNITAEQVFRTFRLMGIAPVVANALTRLTTFKGRIPQGAPTSAMLANLVAGYGRRCLDGRIEGLCKRHGGRNSRWIDDISISGPKYLPKLTRTIETIIDQSSFRPNRDKTKFASRNSPQVVTQHRVNVKPNPPKEERRKLRAMLHKCKTVGPNAFPEKTPEELRNQLRGKINHLCSVNPELGVKFLEDFALIEWPKPVTEKTSRHTGSTETEITGTTTRTDRPAS